MSSVILGLLLHFAFLGLEVNPVLLDKDILWMRWGGTCWWVDLSKRKDGPKLPVWQGGYDFVSMTYNYHVIKGNVKPGDGGNPALCAAPIGVDTSLMVAAPPVVAPPALITAPAGTLTDAGGGLWSFGTQTSTGGNSLLLNGMPAGNGFGKTLQLSNGKVYTSTLDGRSFVWTGTNWVTGTP